MTLRYPTASALERALACPSSVVLPKTYDDASKYAEDGQELHAALQALVEGRAYPSGLKAWAEAAREEGGAILADAATMAEAAFVWDATWEGGEFLGRNLGRNYGSAPARGYCGAADYVRLAPDGVVEVLDLKTGYGAVAPPRSNAQLALLALAACDHYDVKTARVGLLWAPRDATPRAKWGELPKDGLDAFASILGRLTDSLRAYEAQKETLPVVAGGHCTYCKSRKACPVMAQREAEALALPQVSRLAVTPENAGEVWVKVDAARAILDELKSECIRIALAQGGVRLPNGLTRRQVASYTDALDAEVVWRTLSAKWGPEVAKAGVTLDASKASVMRAAKAAKELGAEGSAAALQRDVLKAVEAAGGLSRKSRTEWVDE